MEKPIGHIKIMSLIFQNRRYSIPLLVDINQVTIDNDFEEYRLHNGEGGLYYLNFYWIHMCKCAIAVCQGEDWRRDIILLTNRSPRKYQKDLQNSSLYWTKKNQQIAKSTIIQIGRIDCITSKIQHSLNLTCQKH